jgi:hypothetical protein
MLTRGGVHIYQAMGLQAAQEVLGRRMRSACTTRAIQRKSRMLREMVGAAAPCTNRPWAARFSRYRLGPR